MDGTFLMDRTMAAAAALVAAGEGMTTPFYGSGDDGLRKFILIITVCVEECADNGNDRTIEKQH
jgi:hypothetical protein